MDNEISILLLIGKRRIKLHYTRVKGAESGAEFSGRYLCAIEERIREELGLERMATIPEGIRWAQWRNSGHTFGRFTILGSMEAVETTGQPYQDRTRIRPLPHVRYGDVETAGDAARVLAALP